MASPFQFFRKNQASMMVVLVILAMLAFTLGDLFTQEGTHLWLLGLLLGGAVFGVAGIGSGRWLQWGIGGAILGVLLGLVLPDFNKPPGFLDTTFGLIEQEEVVNLRDRRSVANGFMQLATEEAYGPGARQFARRFGFGHSPQEDLLFSRLMTEEAKSLEISVSDEMVSAFINQHTGDKLSAEAFSDARKKLSYQNSPVNSEMLFDILRDHIRSEIAYLALVPTGSISPPSPEVHWEYFQRMNVRQAINVAELDVDSFIDLDEIKEPIEDDVKLKFDEWRDKGPNQDYPGSPGFILSGRARIAWLEVDYDSMESTVPAITDEDIEAFYTRNREIRYRTIVVPDKEEAAAEDMPAPADKPGDQAPVGATPDSDTDPATDKPETAEDKKADPAAEETPAEAVEEAASEEQPAAPETESAPKEASPEEPAAEGTESSNNGQFSVDDPEAAPDSDASSEAKPPADETATATDKPKTEDDGTTASDPEEPAAAVPAPLMIPSQTEEANDENPAVALEFEYRELDNDLREEIREELLQTRVHAAIDTKMAEGWEFLRDLQKELSEKRAKIMKQDPYPQQFLDNPDKASVDLRSDMAKITPEILERMKDYADENGFTYAVTPTLVSYQDFMSEDDYPLGVASDPNQSQFQAPGSAEAVAYKVYSRFDMNIAENANIAANAAQLFMPERAVYEPLSDEGTESHYAYWAVEFVETHIPELEEPGVRDNVVRTLKRDQARKILTERAELLAQKVRDGLAKADDEKTTMAATLESETITGQDGSATLTVQATQPFAWLRQSQTPQTSFQSRPRAELSAIRFADGVSTLSGVGQEFMKTIFNELGDEEVGIVPSPDRTRYFIVHVTNRFPTKDKGLDGLHDRFALEGRMNFMRSPVMGLMSNDIVNPTVIEWERTLWDEHGVDLDELRVLLASNQQTDG